MKQHILTFLYRYKFQSITLGSLLVWIIIFDTNDIWSQYKMFRNIAALKREKIYYEDLLKVVKKETKELSDLKSTERYAREHYLMHREDEYLYVLTDENDQPLEKEGE